ncbi:alpha/beta hydrolase [Chloroflexi bacterium TSY]|nr:alpha/beta hydrolase [Chloroflexi bacterium TSY]
MIQVDDKSIFYTDNRVHNERPTLIFVHGAGGTHLHWPSELRMFPDAAAYTPDLPGHGRSDAPGRSTIDAYADVLEEFVDAMKLEQVIVVGHSMGGAIAQTVGLRRLSWLTGLVLIGTSARLPVTPIILDGLLEDFPKTVSFIMQMCWSGPLIPAVRVALAGREMRLIPPETVHGDFSACNLFDIRANLGDINVPTLVIGASDDKMTPLKFSHFLVDKIPCAQLAVVKEAGHLTALEYPLRVLDLIRKFASELDDNE